MNTLEITEELLEFLSESEKFCPHFHLSLQSLNTKTLCAMNRHYSAESCMELVEKINGIFKNPFIGSDIIVGFPQETDEDFSLTYENLKKTELSAIHVFPYSVRKNTKAAVMTGQVEMNVKRRRADILHALAEEKYAHFVQKNINQESEILIEKRPDRKTGLLKGVSRNYLNVLLDSQDRSLCNTIQKIKIVKFEASNLFCNIIEGNIPHEFDSVDTTILEVIRNNIVSVLKTVENQKIIENIVRDDKYSTLKTEEYLYGEGRKIIDQYTTSAVCLLKIINLEEINEDISRKTGDAIITKVCEVIKSNLSSQYIFVRYMGPKFAIVFSGIEKSAVAEFMKQIKEQVENIKIEPVDVEFEDEENVFAIPKINVIISTYYKGTALEGVLKKLEEYLDSADKDENKINEL